MTQTPDAASPAAPAATPAEVSERRYRVYEGTTLVLELSDRPGPIRSTAHGGPPVRHPFLSASARSAEHEDRLRKILVAASSFDEFVKGLEAGGFRLEPVTP